MADDQLGLAAAVSMALGGMIGGGIYAVLGVVAGVASYATWVAFVLAGVVALCAGYAFNALNAIDDEHRGGAVSFVQRFVGNTTLAGMTGWTLLVGYVGSMAMYGFAFAEFAVAFAVVPESIAGLSTRPAISVGAIAGFVGLNLLGARTTGLAENVLVALKVGILLAFGVVGLGFALGPGGGVVRLGSISLASAGPVVAAAISFVAFQGWQLLFYDQERVAEPVRTIRRAVYVSIPAAVVIYVLVAVVTVNLVPEAIQAHPHVALKDAARAMLRPYGLATLGGVAIALSAVFSTGSAINATLFSTAFFAKRLLSNGLIPDRIGRSDVDGIPTRTTLVLGAVTAVFSAGGSLEAITSFASLSFIVVFGAVSYLALRERDRPEVHPLPPVVGLAGATGFFPLMLWSLYSREPGTFVAVLLVGVAVVALELLYFEREWIEREAEQIERALAG